MAVSTPLDVPKPANPAPAVMRAASQAYDRARRAKILALATLGGGGVAIAAATASGVLAFLIGRRLRRR